MNLKSRFLLQMLREAKEKAKQQSQQDEEYEETRKAHFGAQFDDFQGTTDALFNSPLEIFSLFQVWFSWRRLRC